MQNFKLSPNFTYREFVRSDTGERQGIANTPNLQQFRNGVYCAVNMEEVRAVCGNRVVRVNSWFRSLKLNDAIGGADNSSHMRGVTTDFTVDGLTVQEVYDILRASSINYKKMIVEFNAWIHLETHELDVGEKGLDLIAYGTRANPQYRKA